MDDNLNAENHFQKKFLLELLRGGFAPVVILLREFQYDKTGIVLDGLHFSAWSLLGHMMHRQKIFLAFIQNPEKDIDLWPEAHWPQDFEPKSENEWSAAIKEFEADLETITRLVKDAGTALHKIQSNGKSLFWAAVANLQHNAYHIGQMKTIGRQLGVW